MTLRGIPGDGQINIQQTISTQNGLWDRVQQDAFDDAVRSEVGDGNFDALVVSADADGNGRLDLQELPGAAAWLDAFPNVQAQFTAPLPGQATQNPNLFDDWFAQLNPEEQGIALLNQRFDQFYRGNGFVLIEYGNNVQIPPNINIVEQAGIRNRTAAIISEADLVNSGLPIRLNPEVRFDRANGPDIIYGYGDLDVQGYLDEPPGDAVLNDVVLPDGFDGQLTRAELDQFFARGPGAFGTQLGEAYATLVGAPAELPYYRQVDQAGNLGPWQKNPYFNRPQFGFDGNRWRQGDADFSFPITGQGNQAVVPDTPGLFQVTSDDPVQNLPIGAIWPTIGNAPGATTTVTTATANNVIGVFIDREGGDGDGDGDPLVFDLEGDGYDILARDAQGGTWITDIMGIGQHDEHGLRVGAGDGVLAFDLDGDGVVGEHGGEIFSNYTMRQGSLDFETSQSSRVVSRDRDSTVTQDGRITEEVVTEQVTTETTTTNTPFVQIRDPLTGQITSRAVGQDALQRGEYANGFEALEDMARIVLGDQAVADRVLDLAEIRQLEDQIGFTLLINGEPTRLTAIGIDQIQLDYLDGLAQRVADYADLRQEGTFRRNIQVADFSALAPNNP